MKATSKQEFFELLGYELNRIGIEDTSEIFVDFEEHFSNGFIRGIPENEIAEGLGDIKEIARSYLNLESSRLNSIMAHELERGKVSLTKPGRSVPADLSLLKDDSARSQDIKDIMNSDSIRSYTPEHLSAEIYPDPPSSASNSQAAVSQGTIPQGTIPQGTIPQGTIPQGTMPQGTSSAAGFQTVGGNGASGANAGNRQNASAKPRKPFSRISDFKGMKANVNSEKLAVAIILDVFVWSWLLPMIAGGLIAMFGLGIALYFEEGMGTLFDSNYGIISKLFLSSGLCSLGIALSLIMFCLTRQFIKLIKFVIILHYKAVYNV